MQFGKFGKPFAVHRCLGEKGIWSTDVYVHFLNERKQIPIGAKDFVIGAYSNLKFLKFCVFTFKTKFINITNLNWVNNWYAVF